MKEPKTLKDFETDEDYDEADRLHNSILITDLRAEAIKILKLLQDGNAEWDKIKSKIYSEQTIDFILWFFNIEEDLKNDKS